jgi:3-oxoacyl-(acyl-carrier-protein) synthase
VTTAAIDGVIGEAPRTACIEAVLSSSFGFGGQNANVVRVAVVTTAVVVALGRPSC